MGLSVIPPPSYRRISSAGAISVAMFIGGAFPTLAEPLPDLRPALVGSGPNSLINLINTKRLVEQGQDHAAVLFHCTIQPNGEVSGARVYNGTPGSDKLKQEVKRCLDKARFIPAVYNHRKTYAGFFGTVRFTQNNGKPRLRIFANQEQAELQHETDFIAPQPFTMPTHYYGYVKYPARAWSTEDVPGVAEMLLTIDASGKLTDVKLLREDPPGNRFGETAIKEMWNRTYLPAFRNGRPVNSTTHFFLLFVPEFWEMKR